MKRFLFYITGLLVLLQAASCVQETEITPAPASTRSVQFHFRASAGDAETRALNSNEEVEVNNIYMLAFTENSGVYEYAYTPQVSNLSITNGSGTFDAVLRTSPSNQKFLIIANAGSLATSVVPQVGETYEGVTSRLECILADRWPAKLDGLTAFTAIPMCANSGAVIVGSSTSTLGPLQLVRMLARIDVSLGTALTSPSELFKLTGVYLFRPYKSGWVHYNDAPAYWSTTGDGVSVTTAHALKAYVPTGVEKVAKENYFTYTVPAADKYAFRNSIYMFEALGVTDLSQATAIVIGGEKVSDPGNVRYYRIDIKTLPADATLPSGYKTADILRNFWYDIVINSVDGEGSDTPIEAYDGNFTVNATVTPYNQAAMKTIIDKQYHLTVDPLNLVFDATASKQIVTAETDYNRSDLGFPAGIQVDEAEIVYTPAVASGDEWIILSNENSTSPGDLFREIGVNVLANSGILGRSAKIYVKAGNMTNVVHVKQDRTPLVIPGGGTPIGTNTYVGAFWRADQTGERLIKIPIVAAAAGDWSVYVNDYGDDFNEGDIVFSTADSSDPDIYTNNAADMIGANDGIYTVAGNDISASGKAVTNGHIFFRIGLKTKWSDQPGYNAVTKPARYAVIVISYKNNTMYQKIFLRQGHEADYLMAPGDPDENDMAFVNRTATYTRKFSPYNLTAPFTDDASPYYIQLAVRGGCESRYPSQAGAFFQSAPKADAVQRLAYHPSTIKDISWSTTSLPWDADIHETCPNGYRRPNTDGDKIGDNTTSEFYLSLLSNPTTHNLNNSVWGYYADGFFDRRPIVTSIAYSGTSASSAVIPTTYEVAYIGRLFFNPVEDSERCNASLFFPAIGYRSTSDSIWGKLVSPGSRACYWSSSSSGNAGNNLSTNRTTITFNTSNVKSHGFAVRCVAE